MSKTLVGLYDTLIDAEHVAQDLATHGFSRSDIRVAAQNGKAHRGTDAYVGEWISANEGVDMVDTLTDLGVPTDEARSYAEGLRRGGALMIVESSDDRADRGIEIMNRVQVVDSDERPTTAASERPTTAASERPTTAANVHTEVRQERQQSGRRLENDNDVVIPIVEEELSVGKRAVERGRVRVHSRVVERPVEETVRLRDETVTVERRPVDRPATDADLAATRDRTIEVTETDEEAVVSKRSRVVEEVVVHKDAEEHVETVRETVRRTEVDVDRDAETSTRAARPAATTGFATDESDFRQHHSATFANRGAYENYMPAYRYGYDLGADERYRGRDWPALEADARRDWEGRHAGTWEQYKDAIRYGWNKLRGRV